jgi:hypothetical protein
MSRLGGGKITGSARNVCGALQPPRGRGMMGHKQPNHQREYNRNCARRKRAEARAAKAQLETIKGVAIAI